MKFSSIRSIMISTTTVTSSTMFYKESSILLGDISILRLIAVKHIDQATWRSKDPSAPKLIHHFPRLRNLPKDHPLGDPYDTRRTLLFVA